ncbi:MAG TPA: hypothetical protein PLA41_00790 [Candidatus Pacearchaeota archaeon]|mgnify:CR=1 FL=1|nr:hypothetical protein [Candidatus Pacearchaeota archaeon]HQI74602.1 hypothetical protein [Candidatus Pacearchaeota archaeon]
MFYKCPKCDRRWQYPVEKCPECFETLQKMKNKQTKVIGITKVSIPTLTHPNVPFNILLLEDEFGNKWSYKTQREYKENDNFILETAKTRDAVAVWTWKYDILETLDKLEYLLNGFKIDSDSTVLILPKLTKAEHPYLRENTSPEFLDCLIKFVISKGVNPLNIMVGAQSFTDTPIEMMAQKSQLLEVCQQNGVNPLIISMAGFDELYNLRISEFAKKVSLIINAPILKEGQDWASQNLLTLLEKNDYLKLTDKEKKQEAIDKIISGLNNIVTIAQADEIQNANKIMETIAIFLAGYNAKNIDKVFSDILLNQPGAGKDIEVVGREILDMQFKPRN